MNKGVTEGKVPIMGVLRTGFTEVIKMQGRVEKKGSHSAI